MKRILIMLLIPALLLFTGCTKTPEAGEGPSQEAQDVSGGEIAETKTDKSIIRQAAWCVYWDSASLSAAVETNAEYRELILFGCIYAEDYTLLVPNELSELIAQLPDRSAPGRPELYLSFINDVVHPDGSSTQKSTAFLQEILPDAERSDALIDAMIRQTQAFGLDGIELDYENVHKCDGLWDAYLDFVSRLWQRAAAENLKLRVILSVSTPVKELNYVEGPRYVVMCYNLYGYHSEAGPKADEAFLQNTLRKFERLDPEYALANGGFEWGPQGKVLRSMTAEAAAALAGETGAQETRESSGAVHYTFRAEDGLHTVYYGDEETIQRWSEILLDQADGDIRIDLWRME